MSHHSHHRPQQFRSAHVAGHHGHTNPKFDEQGGTRTARSIGHRSLHHHHRRVRLVLYPGEGVRTFVYSSTGKKYDLADEKLVTYYGRIYVVGGRGESYEAVAGPPPGVKGDTRGGHRAGSTPKGWFILAKKEHHTTLNWPMSSIAYGSDLRIGTDGLVEYLHVGNWLKANGPHGTWTKATKIFNQRDNLGAIITDEDLKAFHKAAYNAKRELRPEWILNDFGEWAWNLTRGGKRTPFYLHTTPSDEFYMRAPAEVEKFHELIGQSHGCVHVLPKDRNEMMQRGYLRAGVPLLVMPYNRKGPPRS